MLGIEPVDYNGCKVVPMEFLKKLLPDPATLGERTKGKTNIGIVATGYKNGKKSRIYIYQVKDHEECYKEVKAQGVSYTTGVPAVIGAMLVLKGVWSGTGVFNMEELDPDPFMELMNTQGLPWQIEELPVDE